MGGGIWGGGSVRVREAVSYRGGSWDGSWLCTTCKKLAKNQTEKPLATTHKNEQGERASQAIHNTAAQSNGAKYTHTLPHKEQPPRHARVQHI